MDITVRHTLPAECTTLGTVTARARLDDGLLDFGGATRTGAN